MQCSVKSKLINLKPLVDGKLILLGIDVRAVIEGEGDGRNTGWQSGGAG